MKLRGPEGVRIETLHQEKEEAGYLYTPHTRSLYIVQLLACGVGQLNVTRRTVSFRICPHFPSSVPRQDLCKRSKMSLFGPSCLPHSLAAVSSCFLPLSFGDLLHLITMTWPLPKVERNAPGAAP